MTHSTAPSSDASPCTPVRVFDWWLTFTAWSGTNR
jgi:hypothetical protein